MPDTAIRSGHDRWAIVAYVRKLEKAEMEASK
jgi:hypothetical protein